MSRQLLSEQRDRCLRTIALAREHCNCTLSLLPPHRNPYRELDEKAVTRLHEKVKNSLVRAIGDQPVFVHLSADDCVRESISYSGAHIESKRGRVQRLRVESPSWIDDNWLVFAGKWEFGTRRDVQLFFNASSQSLKILATPWYDPDVLVNPSILSSPRTVSFIHEQLVPGRICFSVCSVRLRSSEIFYHEDDVEKTVRTICEAAHKTRWWK